MTGREGWVFFHLKCRGGRVEEDRAEENGFEWASRLGSGEEG